MYTQFHLVADMPGTYYLPKSGSICVVGVGWKSGSTHLKDSYVTVFGLK